MHTTINQERINLGNVDRKSRELQNKCEFLSEIEQDLSKCLQILHTILDQSVKKAENVRKLEELNDIIYLQSNTLSELDIKIKQLSSQLVNSTERLSKLEAAQVEKRRSIQIHLEALKTEYSSLSQDRTCINEKMDIAEAQSKDIEIKVQYDFI